MRSQTTGYVFAVLTFAIFACQDAISKHLGALYPPVFVAMVRYWVFAVFSIMMAVRFGGGIRAVVRARRPWLQVLRGGVLALQVVCAITAFSTAGLVQTQAIMAVTPLLVAVLSVPVLGEHVGWRRWLAIGAGFVGVMVILKPGLNFLESNLVVPVIAALLLGLYAILTRLAGRDDAPMTSFLYIGVIGALSLSVVGPFYWTPMDAEGLFWLAIVCLTSISSHYCFIRAYECLDAVLVQPISYMQLVLATTIGIVVFDETLHLNVAIGSVIVVAAGLFTIWREAIARRRAVSASE
ncbi:DMT family transporter [Rhizobium sp. CG5]|uniref:DMT family transporter n=1 Tax=Rhizobium sp. CG5 TaxID=2726076 RepID=UPI002033A5BC|nr:DMT family transporter [Rhizobium sp. CG5]MCM2476391.1 DMT family transporter [Rhizobium sp. CG5]